MGIYTKTGDDGTTSLAYGTRVMKDDIRVDVYGTVDELNSFIGLLYSETKSEELLLIQSKLFEIGGYFANERSESSSINEEDVLHIESKIDEIESKIPSLHCFILPGGTRNAALSHICRTVCRRLERLMVSYQNIVGKELDKSMSRYINRLSDFFFVFARYMNLIAGLSDLPLRKV